MRDVVIAVTLLILTGPAWAGVDIEKKDETELKPPYKISGPITATPGSDGLSLVGLSYVETPQGYLPVFIIWDLDQDTRKVSEFHYQTKEMKKHASYVPLGACRCGNGDTVIVPLVGEGDLIRLDANGNLVNARSQVRTASHRESFVFVKPDQANGIWLGTTLGNAAHLYNLNAVNKVLLQVDYSFDEYTIFRDATHFADSDELAICGLSWQMEGPKQVWIAKVDSSGQVVKKTGFFVAAFSVRGYRLVLLPGNHVALVYEEPGANQPGTLYLRVFDADLQPVTDSLTLGQSGFPGAFSAVAVEGKLAILAQTSDGKAVMTVLDPKGRLEGRQELGISEVHQYSLVALGKRVFTIGPSERSSKVLLKSLQLEAASQPSQ